MRRICKWVFRMIAKKYRVDYRYHDAAVEYRLTARLQSLSPKDRDSYLMLVLASQKYFITRASGEVPSEARLERVYNIIDLV
jgi:hypothetical protein